MIRGLVWLLLVGGFVLVGATVPLGKRTLFGHVAAIWRTPEAAEMRDGIREKAGPTVERVKRGVAAGVEAAREGDATPADAPTGIDARPAGPDARSLSPRTPSPSP
ncbi:MAG: hypothetical protein R2939_04190 [Kofleriaceae bacterium]